MKYREFKIKDELNQLSYVTFRTKLQDEKPGAWPEITHLPEELFYYYMVKAAIAGDWIEPIEEENDTARRLLGPGPIAGRST